MGLSRKQVLSIGQATARVCLWEGSVRSGKTFASLVRWFTFVAQHPKGSPGELVMVGRSRDSLFRNIFSAIARDPGLAVFAPHVRYRAGANTAKIFGQTVHVIGAIDSRAEEKLRGMTVAGCYMDELTVLPIEFFQQMLARMSVPGAEMFATTNPDTPSHWLKKKYLDRMDEMNAGYPERLAEWLAGDQLTPRPQKPWSAFHFTMEDNPSLSEEYKAALKREYTGLWYQRFILGMWVAAEGAVYQEWQENKHVVAWAKCPPLQRLLCIGMDYGTTNASVGILLGLTDEYDEKHRPTPRLVALDEWRYDSKASGHRLTDTQLSESFRLWKDALQVPGTEPLNPPRLIILDPAAASFAEQLRVDGVTTWQADNDVREGIADVASLLANDRLIVTDHCKGLIEEIPGYVWDDKATERGFDAPLKANDHSVDALRYAIRTSKYLWQPILHRAYGLRAVETTAA